MVDLRALPTSKSAAGAFWLAAPTLKVICWFFYLIIVILIISPNHFMHPVGSLAPSDKEVLSAVVPEAVQEVGGKAPSKFSFKVVRDRRVAKPI